METTWSIPENAAVGRLRQAIVAHPHDPQVAQRDQDLLAEFWRRFPRERLRDMKLEDYALGTGNDQSFCYWLERRLSSLGAYNPGTARGHFIYKDAKNDSWYRLRKWQDLPPEEVMRKVAEWQAQVVEIGGSDHPERLDQTELSIRNARGRVLRLLSAYYPDRFLPIMNSDHLAHFLSLFGVPAEALPGGAVGRSLLLHKLYEEFGVPARLTSFEFMRVLYTPEFDPAQTLIKNHHRFKGAKRLFCWLVGDQGFRSQRYLDEERSYKVQLSEAWRRAVSPAAIDEALADGKEVTFTDTVSRLLTSKENNLLPWRYHGIFKGLQEAPHARTFLQALRDLLTFEAEAAPDLDRFSRTMQPLYERSLGDSAAPASRTLPTLMLWLSYPETELLIQPEVLSRMRKVLTGGGQEAQPLLTTVEYTQARDLAGALLALLTDLGAEDMIDVQGFCWLVFRTGKIWFGGAQYGSDHKRDMFPDFLKAKVFATNYATRPDIAAIMKDAARYDREERAAKRKVLARLLEGRGERAVLELFDLTGLPNSLVIAKSTFRKNNTSMIRIRGVGRTRPESASDDPLGHQVGVDWFAQPDERLTLGSAWASVNDTLSGVALDKALLILAGEAGHGDEGDAPEPTGRPLVPPQPADPKGKPDVQPMLVDLPLNLILYGPPGTGKTWQIVTEYRPKFEDGDGSRWSMVTFHPGYSYEEFIEGLRPTGGGQDGQVQYRVMPGIFRQIAERAERDPARPYALFIDEINRGNVAALFGELITLLEEDKRCAQGDGRGVRLTLPYSKEQFGVPRNLYIIGTMNTADRSIALLDVALRRRFHFREIGVDVQALRGRLIDNGFADGLVEGIDVARMLAVMNERIHYLYDRDHQIGHAWLMEVRAFSELKDVFRVKILPLLVEYFYEDWAKICQVLGENPKRIEPGDLIQKTIYNAQRQRELFRGVLDRHEDKVLYGFTHAKDWQPAHFKKIYGDRGQ